MDPELLDMIQEQILSYRDEGKLKDLIDVCNELVGEDNSTCIFFLMGCVYGSCNFLLDSFVTKNSRDKVEEEFKNVLFTNLKGLEYIFKEYLKLRRR